MSFDDDDVKKERCLISTVETGSAQTYKIDVIYGNYFFFVKKYYHSFQCVLVYFSDTYSLFVKRCVCVFCHRTLHFIGC